MKRRIGTALLLLVSVARLTYSDAPAGAHADAHAPAGGQADAHEMSDADRQAYVEAERTWRKEREDRLTSDSGWLTVAGLYWFDEGENRFGTDSTNVIRLPEGSAAAQCGAFVREGNRISVRVSSDIAAGAGPGAALKIGEASITERVLRTDQDAGGPDVMTMGRLTMHVIVRGDRIGLRLKDLESSYRKGFSGLHWYDVDPEYRIEGKWVPYDPPKRLSITNVLGQVDEQVCPGYVEFIVDHQDMARLEPVQEDPRSPELFFIFADATSGLATYPGGRFLYTDGPKDGKVVLDFNRAYNPPCAFTPYATCPLPPDVNKLKVRIEAGEQTYGEH